MPRCLIIAGPNGAGKTTFAMNHLPALGIRHFVNADSIAQGLSPLDPESVQTKASRLFLEEIEICIRVEKDFAFETTLSGLGYLRLIERLKAAGWDVGLYYLALHSVEVSRARVRARVSEGGHNIPEDAISRRFRKSLRNLLLRYSLKVDQCFCYMNDLPIRENGPVEDWLIFTNIGSVRIIGRADIYEAIVAQAGFD